MLFLAHLQHEVTRVLLPPQSMLVLRDEARYAYAHRVPMGDEHTFLDRRWPRRLRSSFVFWSSRPDPNAPPLKTGGVRSGRIRLVS